MKDKADDWSARVCKSDSNDSLQDILWHVRMRHVRDTFIAIPTIQIAAVRDLQNQTIQILEPAVSDLRFQHTESIMVIVTKGDNRVFDVARRLLRLSLPALCRSSLRICTGVWP